MKSDGPRGALLLLRASPATEARDLTPPTGVKTGARHLSGFVRKKSNHLDDGVTEAAAENFR